METGDRYCRDFVERQMAARRHEEAEEEKKRWESDFRKMKRKQEEEEAEGYDYLKDFDPSKMNVKTTQPSASAPVVAPTKKMEIKQEEYQRDVKEMTKRDSEIEIRRRNVYQQTHPHFTVDEEVLQGIVCEINKLRTAPRLYMKYIQSLIDFGAYHSHTLSVPGSSATREMKEGVEGARHSLDLLKSAPKLSALSVSEDLSRSCYDLIRDHAPQGLFGHTMSDGTTTEQRLNRYGKIDSRFEELIAYDNGSPDDIVLSWFLDDGDLSRRRRNILLNPNFTLLGISVGPFKHKNMVAVVFTTGYTSSNSANA